MEPQVPEGIRVVYHYATALITPNGRVLSEPHRCCTATLIAENPGGEFPVAAGASVCNPRDQFNKKIGRQIALGRAVKALDRKLGMARS